MPKINNYDITIGANLSFLNKGELVQVDVKPAPTEAGFNTSINNALKKSTNIELLPIKEGENFNYNSISKNAYTMDSNTSVPNKNIYGNGFISINWGKDIDYKDSTHLDACSWLAKTLDAYLGLPALIWEGVVDEGKLGVERRKFYPAGSFISTSEGMQYHVLSNEWLRRRSTRNLIFHNTVDAIRQLFNDPEIRHKKYMSKTAETIIKENDRKTVGEILEYQEIKSPLHYRELLSITHEEDKIL